MGGQSSIQDPVLMPNLEFISIGGSACDKFVMILDYIVPSECVNIRIDMYRSM